jgi:hypothetical protein
MVLTVVVSTVFVGVTCLVMVLRAVVVWHVSVMVFWYEAGRQLAGAAIRDVGDSLVKAMSVYLVFVAVQAEVVAMGLVTVGVTLSVSYCSSCCGVGKTH